MRGLGGADLDVKDFMECAGQDIADVPDVPGFDTMILRMRLISDEYGEMVKELLERKPDLGALGKEMCDLIVVVIGTANAYGIPLADIWDAVHKANMSKFDEHGTPYEVREDGKIMKGPHYKDPEPVIRDLMEMVEEGTRP